MNDKSSEELYGLALLVAELRGALEVLREEVSAGCGTDAPVEELKDGIHFEAVLKADAALALALPEAVERAALERAAIDACLAVDDFHQHVQGIDADSASFDEYYANLGPLIEAKQSALAALQAARRKS